jgi:hypothetical protein
MHFVRAGTARIDMQVISNSSRKTVQKAALDTAQFAGTASVVPLPGSQQTTSEWL